MLPNELKIVLSSLVAFLVTEGLKVVGQWLGKDLSGVGAAIAASLTTAVVVFAESLLLLVPEAYQATVQAVFGLLIALLGAFGVHSQIKKLRPSY
jgi:hypothetical protein